MSLANQVNGDMHVTGRLTAGQLIPSSGSVTNAKVSADDPIEVEKLQHRYMPHIAQAGNAADETRVMHVAHGAGDIVDLKVTQVTAAVGDSTCTVDVQKNGVTILSGVVTIDNGDAALSVQSGSLSVTTYSAGDVFTVIFNATAGTGTLPTGVSATLVLDEDALP